MPKSFVWVKIKVMKTTVNTQPEVHIGKVIQNAILFNFRNPGNIIVNSNNLFQSVTKLFTLLKDRKIDYLLVGGIALLHYIEGRNTEDIDLIMAVSSLEKLPEIEISSRDKNFARCLSGELKIDILFTRNRLFGKVRKQFATTMQFLEHEIPCATVEGLLLLKLYALPSLYCQGNFTRVGIYENDIATLIYNYRPEVDSLLKELARHLSKTDIIAVSEIVSEIERKIERFDKGSARNK